jgi:hypothetical protein
MGLTTWLSSVGPKRIVMLKISSLMPTAALYFTRATKTSHTMLILESVFTPLHMAPSPLPDLMGVVTGVWNILLAELAHHRLISLSAAAFVGSGGMGG